MWTVMQCGGLDLVCVIDGAAAPSYLLSPCNKIIWNQLGPREDSCSFDGRVSRGPH